MKVLIADDMFTNRLSITSILKKMGYTYDEATNGQEAIDKIISNNYDLVLLDIEMPVMNGFETVKYIRENLDNNKKFTPVVIISSHGSLSFFKNYDNYGYNAVLKKPFTQEKLEKIIDKIKTSHP